MDEDANANTPVSDSTITSTAQTADQLPPASDGDYAKLVGLQAKDIEAGRQSDLANNDNDEPVTPKQQQQQPAEEKPAEPETPLSRLAAKRVQQRDMTGFDEEEQKLLRAMSNEAFNKYAPELRKLKQWGDLPTKFEQTQKELEEARRAKWQDHPAAYKLTDEYQEVTSTKEKVGQIERHYRQQLAAIRGGATQYTPLSTDAKGNILEGRPVPASPTTGDEIFELVQMAVQDKSALDAREGEIKAQHSQRWGSHKTALESMYTKHFAPHEAVIKADADKWLATFPPYFRPSMEAKLLAAQMATNEYILKQQQASAGSKQIASAEKKALRNGSPTQKDLATDTPASDGSPGQGLPTFNQFKQMFGV